MARYIDAEKLEEALRVDYDREGKKANTYAALGDDDLSVKYSHGQFCYLNAIERVKDVPTADVAPRAEVIEEYRKKVYAKMEKYTVFGREYIQRIMREVEKEYTEGQK